MNKSQYFENVFEIACPIRDMQENNALAECSLWSHGGYSDLNFDRNMANVMINKVVLGTSEQGKNPHGLKIWNEHPIVYFRNYTKHNNNHSKIMIIRFNGEATCMLKNNNILECKDPITEPEKRKFRWLRKKQ